MARESAGAPALDLENYKKFYGFGIPKVRREAGMSNMDYYVSTASQLGRGQGEREWGLEGRLGQ